MPVAMTSISSGNVNTNMSRVTESSFKSIDWRDSAFSKQLVNSPATTQQINNWDWNTSPTMFNYMDKLFYMDSYFILIYLIDYCPIMSKPHV